MVLDIGLVMMKKVLSMVVLLNRWNSGELWELELELF